MPDCFVIPMCQTAIAFTYGGDIWTVPIEGGVATKLSFPSGAGIAPKFSPDGQTLAFTGNYDGNSDIYTIPAGGGVPKRVTHHGMDDRIQDWYPDGRSLLFTSAMESGKQRFNQFYKVSKDGGLPTKLPLAYGEFGSLSPDGKKIAFTDKSRVFRNWKRYKGGMAAEVFVFDLETYESYNISNSVANDEVPMWDSNTGKIFFLSDRVPENRFNICSYDLKDKKLNQVTKFKDFDVHTPSLGPNHMVFESGGKILILGLADLQSREVSIQITSDFATLKPRNVAASNGGQIPDRFVELLNRKPLAFFAVRDGKDWQWPPIAHFGTMAMLANGWSGSSGDAFPDYFKKSGLGPVIGTRTWGGLIGISGSPSLIDGGSVTVPTFRMYIPDFTWFKEGHGVDPDIEVLEDPTELAKGVDGQLDAAIEYILSQIEKKGQIHPKRPPREKRS